MASYLDAVEMKRGAELAATLGPRRADETETQYAARALALAHAEIARRGGVMDRVADALESPRNAAGLLVL